MTHISSRDFNQDVSRAKRAALSAPVVITDRGKPAHVLLSFQDYEKMQAKQPGITDLLSMPETDIIEFAPSKVQQLYQSAHF
ncbi:MAG: type II toxin-antitoxin system Phd/YefM family antitoxin [Pseudomonadota bacterium]